MHGRYVKLAAVVVIGVALIACTTCGITSALLADRLWTSPTEAVEATLRLRRAGSTDAIEYAKYVSDPAVAAALARDAREPSVRPWDQVTCTSCVDGRAEVMVQWHPDPAHEDLPLVTVFYLSRVDWGWKIVDAGQF